MFGCRGSSVLISVCLIAILFAACGGGGGGGTSDTTAPTVDLTTPTDGATGVNVNSTVSVVFNEAMDPSTFTTATCLASHGTFSAINFNASRDIATLTPNQPFPFDTSVSITVTTGVTDSAGNPLAVDFNWSFDTEPDLYAPLVSSTDPASGATGVALDLSAVTATFSEAMDGLTIGSADFTVAGLTGTVSYDDPTRTATISLSGPLSYGQTYSATIGTGVTDSAGNHLAEAYTWSFTATEDTVPPTVTLTSPMDGAVDVGVSSTVAAVFSEAMDPATIGTSTFLVSGVTGSVSYNASTYRAVFTPAGNLPYATNLDATITAGARDLQGIPIASGYSWSFTTESDVIPPAVESIFPLNDQSLVSVSSAVRVTFSEPMDPGTINASTFRVLTVPGSVSYEDSTFSAVFTPSTPLSYYQNHLAVLSTGITDAQGIPLAGQYQWAFNTAGQEVKVSGFTRADQQVPVFSFKDNGDGIAVWKSMAHPFGKLLYSFFDSATGTWSAEQKLGGYTSNYWVENNGANFMVVWTTYNDPDIGSKLKASFYNGSAWATTVLGSADYNSEAQIASDGTGFMVASVDLSYPGYLKAHHHNGSGWTDTVSLTDAADYRLVPGDAGYCLAWVYDAPSAGYYNYVYARIHNGTAWSATETLTSIVPEIGSLDAASNGTGYGVVWENWADFGGVGRREVNSALYEGTSWSVLGVYSAGGSTSDTSPLMVSDGTGYGLAFKWSDTTLYYSDFSDHWSTPYSVSSGAVTLTPMAITPSATTANRYALLWNSGNNLYARIKSGASWLSTGTLDSTGSFQDVILQSADYHFKVLYTWADGSGPFVWSSTVSSWAYNGILDSSTNPAKDSVLSAFPGGYMAAWAQDLTIHARRFAGSWLPSVDLVQGQHPGGTANLGASATASGSALAVWGQYTGETMGIHASRFDGSVWSAAQEVAGSGRVPAVATDDSYFVVSWETLDSPVPQIITRRMNAALGTWDPSVTVSASGSAPDIAYNGSIYLLTWNGPGYVQGSTSSDGLSWSAPFNISTGNSDPVVASDGTTFLILYDIGDLYGRIYDGTLGPEVFFGAARPFFSSPNGTYEIATSGTGYGVVWQDDDLNGWGRVYNGTSWSTSFKLNTTPYAGTPRIAHDGNNYLALWEDNGLIPASWVTWGAKTSDGNWSVPAVIGEEGYGPFDSNGTGFTTLYVKSDGSFDSLRSHYYDGTEWADSGGYLESSDGNVQSDYLLMRRGGGYLGIWLQHDEENVARAVWTTVGN